MRVLLAVVLATLAAVPAALALPGDPQPAPLTPEDTATLAADPSGIPVTFACPAYRKDVYGDPEDPITDRGSSEDYDVRFSPVPDVDESGVLGNEFSSSAPVTLNADGTTCATKLDTQDSATSPEAVGGTVYWQVSRPCAACTPQVETGPVRSFTVRAPRLASTVRTPKKVYAGYLTRIIVNSKAKVGGAKVALQRKVKGGWKTIAKDDFSESVPFFVKLPKGKQTLRGSITTLGGTSVGTPRTVVARPDTRRTTSRSDDGTYGSGQGGLRLTIADGGRTFKGFQTPVTANCFGATVEDNRFMILFAGIDKAPIAPDGSVTATLQTKDRGSEVQVTGRLRDGRFKGEAFIYISSSRCVGTRKVELTKRSSRGAPVAGTSSAKSKAKAKAKAKRIYNKIKDGRYVGVRGDGEPLDYLICGNGKYATNTGGGISNGKGWKVTFPKTTSKGFTAIVKKGSTSWSMAKTGSQWQIGYEFGDAPQSLGNVTRTDAKADCAAL